MNDQPSSGSQDRLVADSLASAVLKDRRRSRLWKNIRFVIWIVLLLLYAFLIFSPKRSRASDEDIHKPYISLIRLTGVIMPNSSFSADKVIPQLNRAFADKRSKGVILEINSPGGSPVQANLIHDKILQLKKEYKKKVIVVGEDALASGAFLVATAADKIYVNKDTLTGSIGVIMSGFGFTDAIQKIGVTRRVFTAGDHKDRLDPFQPLTPEDKTKVERVLKQVHQNFIDYVLVSRKGKLHGNQQELFSGDFWTGQEAVKLGLADGTADLWTVMKNEFNVTHYRNYSARPSLLSAFLRGVDTQLNLGWFSQDHYTLVEKL